MGGWFFYFEIHLASDFYRWSHQFVSHDLAPSYDVSESTEEYHIVVFWLVNQLMAIPLVIWQ